jgi:hypothetical protein
VLQGVAAEPTVVRFVDDGDAYWTSHLLLDGWLSRLTSQVGGVPVAFAPERGTLIVAADGSAHLAELFSQVGQVYASSPRAITPMAYVSDEHGRTVPVRRSGRPSDARMRRARGGGAGGDRVRPAGDHGRPGRGGATRRSAPSRRDGGRGRCGPHDEPALLPRADEVLIGEAVRLWAEVEQHLTPVPTWTRRAGAPTAGRP